MIIKNQAKLYKNNSVATFPLKLQVHLCGMIEAIEDQPSEMTLLRSQIPSIAQATLPLWKRRLYDPKTACLNFSSQ